MDWGYKVKKDLQIPVLKEGTAWGTETEVNNQNSQGVGKCAGQPCTKNNAIIERMHLSHMPNLLGEGQK